VAWSKSWVLMPFTDVNADLGNVQNRTEPKNENQEKRDVSEEAVQNRTEPSLTSHFRFREIGPGGQIDERGGYGDQFLGPERLSTLRPFPCA
jgi:hypothetical protein